MYDKVDWKRGPNVIYFHKLCQLDMKSSRRLGQAKKRLAKINEEKSEYLDDYTPIQEHTLGSPNEVSRKLTRLSAHLHEKTLCVWCMKADNKK